MARRPGTRALPERGHSTPRDDARVADRAGNHLVVVVQDDLLVILAIHDPPRPSREGPWSASCESALAIVACQLHPVLLLLLAAISQGSLDLLGRLGDPELEDGLGCLVRIEGPCLALGVDDRLVHLTKGPMEAQVIRQGIEGFRRAGLPELQGGALQGIKRRLCAHPSTAVWDIHDTFRQERFQICEALEALDGLAKGDDTKPRLALLGDMDRDGGGQVDALVAEGEGELLGEPRVLEAPLLRDALAGPLSPPPSPPPLSISLSPPLSSSQSGCVAAALCSRSA